MSQSTNCVLIIGLFWQFACSAAPSEVADEQSEVEADATITYFYHPGDPMNLFASHTPNQCTGSWAVRRLSDNQAFFSTAGHCFEPPQTIYGTDGPFALDTDDATGSFDGLLGFPFSNTDAQQIVNGNRVVGLLDNGRFTSGQRVLKLGLRTGLTEGAVVGWSTWLFGEPTVCVRGTNSPVFGDHGDSGAPVFTQDGHGQAWAAGMYVGTIDFDFGRLYCFLTISQVLNEFGAYLPVFPARGAPSSAGMTAARAPRASFPADLPELKGGTITPF